MGCFCNDQVLGSPVHFLARTARCFLGPRLEQRHLQDGPHKTELFLETKVLEKTSFCRMLSCPNKVRSLFTVNLVLYCYGRTDDLHHDHGMRIQEAALILAQFSTEQRVRSEGDSGMTNVRGHYDGNAAFDNGTYTNGAVAPIHDHADNIIVGIGEIAAVLNGVEFQARHNDYNLSMPSTTSGEYGATGPIVPGVEMQIMEMKEWFRAFVAERVSPRLHGAFPADPVPPGGHVDHVRQLPAHDRRGVVAAAARQGALDGEQRAQAMRHVQAFAVMMRIYLRLSEGGNACYLKAMVAWTALGYSCTASDRHPLSRGLCRPSFCVPPGHSP